MRSYYPYRALARALDVIGDRWTLLIVRELFTRETLYSDLREALPGIATNLLAARLKQLEADDVIERHEAGGPVAADVYRLTARGRRLGPVLLALVEWGVPLLARGRDDDEFRAHWLVEVMPILFRGVEVADLAPLTVVLDMGSETATIRLGEDGLGAGIGAPSRADSEIVVVKGEPPAIIALLAEEGGATHPGLTFQGPADAVRRLQALIARRSARI